MAGLYGYALMVKQVQDDAIRIYNAGEKNFALLRALGRRKLRIVENFTDLDRELLKDYQLLLYYKSKIPDMLLSFSMNPEKSQQVYKEIGKINEAVKKVEQAVQELRESPIIKEFFDIEKGKRRPRTQATGAGNQESGSDTVESAGASDGDSSSDNGNKEVAENTEQQNIPEVEI